MQCAKRDGTGGFTLLEVVVALAIVGLALAAIAGVFRNGVVGHAVAADADAALAVAEERLALAGAEILRPGRSEGSFDRRFAWQTTIAPYDDDAADPAAALRLYRIEVAVAWRDGHRGRRLSLATLRLAPAAP